MLFEAIVGVSVLALLFAWFLTRSVMKKDKGTEKMIEISNAIQEGAMAFLNRQYRTVSVFVVVIAVILYFVLNPITAASFVVGAVLSALAGYIGMLISIRANVRTAKAAESGLQSALTTAFRAGAVNGFAIVGLGLLGISVLFYLVGNPDLIIGFAFGASLVSLFARVGGGIFTKAADVGADIVGKVEKSIPEDDPRNPAVIADNVGDNVGDCAGMGADLFESYVVTLLAAMILGRTFFGVPGMLFPLAMGAVGIIASMIAVFFVKTKSESGIWPALNKGILVASVLSAIGFYALSTKVLSINIFYAGVVGLAAGVVIGYITDHYTSKEKSPVKNIAKASETGAGTNVIYGLSVGMRSTIFPVIVICIAILASYYFGSMSGAGVYGIAIAAMGLLSITGIVMSVDTFGPISDNAGGIAEMSGMPKETRKVTDALDAVGNTTKAITKGIAIASAALSALALLAAFLQATHIGAINIVKPVVLVGLLIGASLPFLFSSFLMKAVGNAAQLIVKEVRRQFIEIKGIMKGKAKPDYAKAVDISTQAALKELVAPALLAVLSPIVVGLVLGSEALGAMLLGTIASGLLMALFLCNAGAAWDNAKKYIEAGNLGGKGSDTHKAAVVGDTVGDPSKDTAGPAINSLIKVLNTLAIVLAPLLLALML